jgi:hypothetical protein
MAAELNGTGAGDPSATVSKRVGALGESMDAFPKVRLWELAQKVSEEIAARDRREKFLHTMANEIRGLP